MAEDRIYIAIDLKSFFASVECRGRDLDPLNTNLVVADATRTEKTICLAVHPHSSPMVFPAEPAFLKSYSVCGRKIKRAAAAPGHCLEGTSYSHDDLQKDPSLAIDYLIAPPTDGTLHGIQHPDLPYLSAICRPGGYSCLLH